MKKFLILLVLVAMSVGEAAAQKYYVPRFKKTKVERDYKLDSKDHKFGINFGGGYNVCMGMLTSAKYGERGDKVTYKESMSVSGGSIHLGAVYRLTENFMAGLESGFQFQKNDNSIPLYATFKYYYGNAVQKKRTRWFNYLNAGTQFYLDSNSRLMGFLVGAGGGMRLLVGKTLKADFYLGYQLNMRPVVPCTDGKYDIPASDIKFRQYANVIQVGMNIPLW